MNPHSCVPKPDGLIVHSHSIRNLRTNMEHGSWIPDRWTTFQHGHEQLNEWNFGPDGANNRLASPAFSLRMVGISVKNSMGINSMKHDQKLRQKPMMSIRKYHLCVSSFVADKFCRKSILLRHRRHRFGSEKALERSSLFISDLNILKAKKIL